MVEHKLTEKIALVTGASSGIGRATARALSDSGARVCINFFGDNQDAISAQKELTAHGGEAMIYEADVSNAAAVSKMVERVEEKWGSIDILVNNAAPPIKRKLLEEFSWEEILAQLNVHCRGALNTMQAVLPKMKEKKYGRIINVLSSYILSAPPQQMAAYIIAKEALFGLSKSAAVEFVKFGIRVNMVSPGPTDTRLFDNLPPRVKELVGAQTSLGRLLEPREIAEVIVNLAVAHNQNNGVNIPIGIR